MLQTFEGLTGYTRRVRDRDMGEWATPDRAAFVAALFLLVLGILAAGEVFLCLREIALNTRQAEVPEEFRAGRTRYTALRIVVSLNNLIGIVLILGAALPFSFAVRWQ